MLFTPFSIADFERAPAQRRTQGGRVPTALALQLGGSFSTAALVTLLARRNSFHQEILAAHAVRSSVAMQSLLANHGTIGGLYATIVTQAGAMSYADAQFALGVLAFVLMPLILILPKRRKDAAHIEIRAE